MSRTGAVIAVFVVAGLLAGGGIIYKLRSHAPAAQAGGAAFEPFEAAKIVPAHEVTWQPTADLVGTVFAIRSVEVSNELAGVVTEVGFDSGQAVDKDQVLLKLNDATEQADLAAAKAQVRIAQANLAQVDSNIKLAEVELNRMSGIESRAIADVELDRARNKLAAAQADRERWLAEADQATAHVAQVQARLEKLTIKAPFRARAGIRTVHEGQYLKEGSSVVALQELTDTIYLDFAIPQEYAPRVLPGSVVMADAPLLGKDPVKITVVAADASVNIDTRNLRVRAVVDNPKGVLAPGMSVQVRVPIDLPQKLVAVPSTAVRRAAFGDSVFVVTKDDKGDMRAHQKFVQLGQAIGDDVIVKEGIEAGELIAAAGSFKLRDGVKVVDQPPQDTQHSNAQDAPAEKKPAELAKTSDSK
ncbi:MAG: efflux RND transporter periplasmic adaptor subunit [Tepidisphaera sp.]|nr:efflux RND transporter periplasmic adaptor subunit [Tepidisphaera sp.]